MRSAYIFIGGSLELNSILHNLRREIPDSTSTRQDKTCAELSGGGGQESDGMRSVRRSCEEPS